MLGDYVTNALTAVGVTEQRVSSWLGKPCGCEQRRQRLNQLHAWAVRVLRGRTERAAEYLDRIMGATDDGAESANNMPVLRQHGSRTGNHPG